MRGIDESTNYDPQSLATVKGSPWRVYRRLLGYVWQYKARLAVSIAFALVVAASFGTIIFGIGKTVGILFGKEDEVRAETDKTVAKIDEKTAKIENALGWAPRGLGERYHRVIEAMLADKMKWLVGACVVAVVLAMVSGLARFIQEYLAASVATYVTIDLGREMFANLMTLSIRFFEERTTGDIVARLSNDIFMSGRGLTSVFMKLFREPFKALACLALALWMDAGLTLVGLCVLPAVAYVLIAIGKKMRKRVRRSLEKIASLVTAAKEALTGIHIVKGFCMEGHQIARVNDEYRKLRHQGLKMLQAEALVGPLTEFVLVIGIVAFVLLSGRKVIQEEMAGGDLLILYLALAGMLDPVRKLASLNNAVQTSVASAERVFEFIDLRPDVAEAPDAVDLPRIQESLRFEDVAFSYDGKTDVLRGVDLDIRKGEMVAIVGFSGAGKTTMAKLVPRFYDVTRGSITVDGVDVRRATFASLRGQISIVTQDTILFDDTVRANIEAGKPDYPDERVIAAAKAAHAADFIEELPNGYDTRIGESGGTLSGGQRQRLAIARALIKDPAILILDEATSSLDSESEQAIQQAIEEFVVGRTTIVIAHRLSTVQRADRIVVLDEGRIVEQGTHDELLQRDGSIYRRLYEIQFAAATKG